MNKTALKIISFFMVLLIMSTCCSFEFSALGETYSEAAEKSSKTVIVIPQKVPVTGKVVEITYECCEECGYKKTYTYGEGAKITANYSGYCCDGENAFVCWVDENGKKYYGGESLPFESATLRAQKMPLLLSGDEVLNFSNGDEYFHTDEFDGYYMNEYDYRMMQKNTVRLFGLLNPVTAGLLAVFATYQNWEWAGSCYGMSTLAFLQHYGVIDILEPENGIDSLSDFSNSADVASKINYYQWSAAGSFLCENFAVNKGSAVYSRQLKELYETVEKGNIVLFTSYSGKIFSTSGHTVLLTGAYTKEDGTRVLIAYDNNNHTDYRNGRFEQRLYIDPECTSIKRVYNSMGTAYLNIGSFNWTDDYSHFEPFNTDGKGDILVWYSHFAKQLSKNIRIAFEAAFNIEN